MRTGVSMEPRREVTRTRSPSSSTLPVDTGLKRKEGRDMKSNGRTPARVLEGALRALYLLTACC
jgi:hypothetical protein